VSDGKFYIYIGEPDSPRSNCNVYITNVSIVQETIGFTHKRVEEPKKASILDEIRYENIVSGIPRNFGDMVPIPDDQVASLTVPSVNEDNVFLEENWFYLAFKQDETKTLQSLTLEPYVRFIQSPDTDATVPASGYTSDNVQLFSSPDGVVWTNTNCTINGNKNGGAVVLTPTASASAKYFQVGINFEDNNGSVHIAGFIPAFSN